MGPQPRRGEKRQIFGFYIRNDELFRPRAAGQKARGDRPEEEIDNGRLARADAPTKQEAFGRFFDGHASKTPPEIILMKCDFLGRLCRL